MPHRARRRLTGLAFAVLAGAAPALADRADFVASLRLPRQEACSGLSGIEVIDAGTGFLAVSDKGAFVTGSILRKAGKPVAATGLQRFAFRPLPGQPRLLYAGRDAEGLALAPDGSAYVSFERWHRIWRWREIGAAPKAQPDIPGSARFGANTGIEALAFGPDGALYAVPETLVARGALPVYRNRGSRWDRPFTLARRGGFRPVGADFGPDGAFYLLERAFVAPFGFRSRIRRFAFSPGGFTDEETLLETSIGRHGNLEGLSVWRDGSGAIRLTMVTDDNGNAFQRNQIVEYRVVSGAAGG